MSTMIKEKLTTMLNRCFKMDGNGILETPVSIEQYEAQTGADITKTGTIITNEYGSQDWKHELIDENCDDFAITLEVKDGFITHCYF